MDLMTFRPNDNLHMTFRSMGFQSKTKCRESTIEMSARSVFVQTVKSQNVMVELSLSKCLIRNVTQLAKTFTLTIFLRQ